MRNGCRWQAVYHAHVNMRVPCGREWEPDGKAILTLCLFPTAT